MNDLGQSVGYDYFSSGTFSGFLYQNGQFTPVNGPSGATYARPAGINDLGVIAGTYEYGTEAHGFVERGGKYVTLDDPNAIPGTTNINGINILGQVVGYYLDKEGLERGFLATPTNANAGNGVAPEAVLVSALADHRGLQPASYSASELIANDSQLVQVHTGQQEDMLRMAPASADSLTSRDADSSAWARLVLPGTRTGADQSPAVADLEAWVYKNNL
jgi:hypothetical protein